MAKSPISAGMSALAKDCRMGLRPEAPIHPSTFWAPGGKNTTANVSRSINPHVPVDLRDGRLRICVPPLLMPLTIVARYDPMHQRHSTIRYNTQVDHSSVARENRMALTCDRSTVESDTEA